MSKWTLGHTRRNDNGSQFHTIGPTKEKSRYYVIAVNAQGTRSSTRVEERRVHHPCIPNPGWSSRAHVNTRGRWHQIGNATPKQWSDKQSTTGREANTGHCAVGYGVPQEFLLAMLYKRPLTTAMASLHQNLITMQYFTQLLKVVLFRGSGVSVCYSKNSCQFD